MKSSLKSNVESRKAASPLRILRVFFEAIEVKALHFTDQETRAQRQNNWVRILLLTGL